jgi:hypothetical protein
MKSADREPLGLDDTSRFSRVVGLARDFRMFINELELKIADAAMTIESGQVWPEPTPLAAQFEAGGAPHEKDDAFNGQTSERRGDQLSLPTSGESTGTAHKPNNCNEAAASGTNQAAGEDLWSRLSPKMSHRLKIVHLALKSNPEMSARELCGCLDHERHAIVDDWSEKVPGVKTWVEAFDEPQLQASVRTQLSKAKATLREFGYLP